MNTYFLALLLYGTLLIVIGFIASRRVRTPSDFLVGGRRFGAGTLFATFLAANIGAGSTVGASGLGYRIGLSAWWWVGSAGIGTLILSQTVGPRLWRIAKEHELHTLGDYLELRYSREVRGVIAVILWLGTLAILAGQIIAIAWILSVVIGLPKWAGCIAGGAVAITYCAAGGLASAAVVNMFELAVTMTGLVFSAVYVLHGFGGWQGLTSALGALPNSSGVVRASWTGAGAKQILAYVSILVPSFICSPGLIQKLYGARDEGAVRRGIALNSAGQLLFAFVPAIFGMAALVHFGKLANAELALPSVMIHMVPRWLGIWALAAIFSAELSATDAILFMLSTSLSVDLYQAFLNPGVSPKKLLGISRMTTVLAGIAGVGVAVVLPSIIAAVTIFYGLLAVALFVPLLLGLYWKRMNTHAALACIFVAIVANLIGQYTPLKNHLGILSPALVGILTALLCGIIVAWLVPAPLRSKLSGRLNGGAKESV
ncbi:MAG TPA: sodium:solute symporter family protein [Candidatus Acidoferrum sp.]|nr:sodium:solute symporter family protein [Candidatus Acidoferrum sp.]